MTVNYYLTGRDESKDIVYFIYLASNLNLDRVGECRKWVKRLHEWWEEEGVIPDRLSLTKIPVDVLHFIALFKRLSDACGDYKHFIVSAILEWYGGIVTDEFSIAEKVPEGVKAVVVIEPDLSLVDIKENPNYKPEKAGKKEASQQ